jgi:hypothetical protein
LRCEIEAFKWVHPLVHFKKHLWRLWFINPHLLLLKLASRRLGVARWVPYPCGAPGNVCISHPLWISLSEHQFSFVGIGWGKEALGDNLPFVGSSMET